MVAKLDGSVVPTSFDSATGTISYSTTTPIADGVHTVQITAEDMAGNRTSYSWSYTILTSGPTLDLDKKDQMLTTIFLIPF
ncbi:Ig-like domain-containing protein [Neobacillus niacini]|uniref:Ig-like domain-containing protein n=1 Tax=Neobacillus niacini TaxID=86668 RepID=UPI003B58889A